MEDYQTEFLLSLAQSHKMALENVRPGNPKGILRLSDWRSTTQTQILVPTGVMPTSQRLLPKILNLDFIEIQDLLIEAWLTQGEEDSYRYSTNMPAVTTKYVINIFTGLCVPRQRSLISIP